MKKYVTVFFGLFAGILLLSSPANASASASGAVDDVQVSSSGTNGYLRVKISGASINDGCTSGNTNLFYAERVSNDYFEAFLAIALTAKNSGDDLLVGVNGCTAIGGTTYPKINYLRM
ncbi:MAG: hypothetical protein AAFX54_15370 [Pseudomonadota bacterium]